MRISITTFGLTALLWTESCSFSILSNTRINKATALYSVQGEIENVSTKDRLKKYSQVILDRSDTMKAAGFHEISEENQYPPLQAGAKTNITLFLVALGYKWYRSIFINKVSCTIFNL